MYNQATFICIQGIFTIIYLGSGVWILTKFEVDEKYVEALPDLFAGSLGVGLIISMPCTGVNEMLEAMPLARDLIEVSPPCWRRSIIRCIFWDIL